LTLTLQHKHDNSDFDDRLSLLLLCCSPNPLSTQRTHILNKFNLSQKKKLSLASHFVFLSKHKHAFRNRFLSYSEYELLGFQSLSV
jgi:hypothetical protein